MRDQFKQRGYTVIAQVKKGKLNLEAANVNSNIFYGIR